MQWGAVYTAVPLPAIQWSCSIYCTCSIPYIAKWRVTCKYTANALPHGPYTANTLLWYSVPAVLINIFKKWHMVGWLGILHSAVYALQRHCDYTADTVPSSCSVPVVYTAESEKCICSIYCTSTALRSGIPGPSSLTTSVCCSSINVCGKCQLRLVVAVHRG